MISDQHYRYEFILKEIVRRVGIINKLEVEDKKQQLIDSLEKDNIVSELFETSEATNTDVKSLVNSMQPNEQVYTSIPCKFESGLCISPDDQAKKSPIQEVENNQLEMNTTENPAEPQDNKQTDKEMSPSPSTPLHPPRDGRHVSGMEVSAERDIDNTPIMKIADAITSALTDFTPLCKRPSTSREVLEWERARLLRLGYFIADHNTVPITYTLNPHFVLTKELACLQLEKDWYDDQQDNEENRVTNKTKKERIVKKDSNKSSSPSSAANKRPPEEEVINVQPSVTVVEGKLKLFLSIVTPM